MAQESRFVATSTADFDPSLQINRPEGVSTNEEFCLFGEDDIEMDETDENDKEAFSPGHSEDKSEWSGDSSRSFSDSKVADRFDLSMSMDVETMKRKAEEIANTLRKFRSNRSIDSIEPSEDYEPPEELKRYRERSLYVAQKLKEDQLLYEESKKKSKAVVDKVTNIKRIHKNIAKNAKDLERDEGTSNETLALSLKIERLEASVLHLQKQLAEKNQTLLETNETNRTLNETIINVNGAYMSSLENSKEEIQQLKEEHNKAMEKILNSRDEFCNQLKTVRKKCLVLESNLKLSEFARCRILSNNAQLQKKFNNLGHEDNNTDGASKEVHVGLIDDVSLRPLEEDSIPASELRSKLENISFVVNEFHSYLVDSNYDFDDADQNMITNENDLLECIQFLGDRIKSIYSIAREKLAYVTELKSNSKELEKKLNELQNLNEESKTQETKLRKVLDSTKAKIQSEMNINKELNEEICLLRNVLSQPPQFPLEEWKSKCEELESEKNRLQLELNSIQNEMAHLRTVSNEEIYQLREELAARLKECEKLRRTCGLLEDSNDRLENDFVVLQKRDCDDVENWRRKYDQLTEENVVLTDDIRKLNEKAIEYEEKKIALDNEIGENDTLRQTVQDLRNQLETASQYMTTLQNTKMQYENEMRQEIDKLSSESAQLSNQLASEMNISRNLKEQVLYAENMNAELSGELNEMHVRCNELKIIKESLEDELHAVIDNLKIEKNELEKKLVEYQNSVKIQNEEMKTMQKRLSSVEKEFKEKYETEINYLESNKQIHEEEIKRLLCEREHLTNTCKQYESELLAVPNVGEYNSRIGVVENEDAQLLEKFEKCRLELHTMYEKNAQLQSNVKVLEEKNIQFLASCSVNENYNEIKQRLDELEDEKRQLTDELGKFKSKYQRLQVYCKANISKPGTESGSNTEIDSWKRKFSEINATVVPLEEEVRRLKQVSAELENALTEERVRGYKSEDRLKQTQNDLRSGWEMQESQVRVLQNRIVELENQNNVIQQQCENYNHKLGSLKNSLKKLKSEGLVIAEEAIRMVDECSLSTDINGEMYRRCCQDEAERYQQVIDKLKDELNSYKQQLQQRSEEASTQISKYEELITEMQIELNLMENRVSQADRLLEQKADDFYQYRNQIEEYLHSERDKFDRLNEPMTSVKKETIDVEIQVDDGATFTVENKSPALIKYFDYCTDKLTKGVGNILQPGEQQFTQPVDYSNWILSEKEDTEYQRYQTVPDVSDEKKLDTVDAFVQAVDNQIEQIGEKLPISLVLDRLCNLICSKNENQWFPDDFEWTSNELEIQNEAFVDTSFKFVDLFNAVVKYYSALPGTDIVMKKFECILRPYVSVPDTDKGSMNCRDVYFQLINLITNLECENKYLFDAINFVENILSSRHQNQICMFQNVRELWQLTNYQDQNDIIDRICEEYDIVPNKFTTGDLFTTWKENIMQLLEPTVEIVAQSGSLLPNIEPQVVNLMKKMHQLIGDLYYKYKAGSDFNPNEFFEQIDDVNRDIERLVKLVRNEVIGDEEKAIPVREQIQSKHQHEEKHDYLHRDCELDHHEIYHEPDKRAIDDRSSQLKSLLAESNKKIDSLVRELMEVKNSKEYNEVRQLHSRLDETLYQLHHRDVDIVELTRELTQLLTERDSLQLKLSSIIRQNEQLRQAYIASNSADDPHTSIEDLNNKLEQLGQVNYMKDTRITESSKKHRTAEIQVFCDDQSSSSSKNKNDRPSGLVPTLFKWLTGEPEPES